MVLAILLIGFYHEPTRYAALAAIAVYLATAMLPSRRRRQRAAERSLRRKTAAAVDRHLDVLARKYLVLRQCDDYGLPDDSGWRRELRYFGENIVAPALNETELKLLARTGRGRTDQLPGPSQERRIAKRAAEIAGTIGSADNLTPAEFEAWCAAELRDTGWSARATRATADQGGDVIAERNGVGIVLQCKLYTSPVGNKAVQEAYAAARHYGVRHAAVVSNARFTRAATQLANSTGVLLLHASELGRLEALSGPRGAGGRRQRAARG